MPWECIVPPDVPYVETIVSGMITGEDLKASFFQNIAQAKASGRELLLADCRNIEGGHDIANIILLVELRRMEVDFRFRKEAVIIPTAEKMKNNTSFWETSSVNRGFNVRNFADRQSAIDWLLSP